MVRYCSNPHYSEDFMHVLFRAKFLGVESIFKCRMIEKKGISSVQNGDVFYYVDAVINDFKEENQETAPFYVNKVEVLEEIKIDDFQIGSVVYNNLEEDQEFPPSKDLPFMLFSNEELNILNNYLNAKKEFEEMISNKDLFKINENITYIGKGIFQRKKE